MEILNHLVGSLGTRPAGSSSEHEAASFLADQLRKLGLTVEVQAFNYVGWRPLANPSLQVLSPKPCWLNPQPMLYSGSTPDEGVIGTVVYDGTSYLTPGVHEWRKYGLLGANGETLAQMLVYPNGPAVPFPNPRPLLSMPSVVIGQSDQQALEERLESSGVRARLYSKAEYLPSSVSYNVIANMPGEASDEVLVACAHYDSTYGSPGAVDNASGVEALFRVARLLKDSSLKSVRFIFFAAEEFLMMGSRFYVNLLKERGELSQIKGVVNLDMVGGGDAPVAFYGPESVRRSLDLALQLSGISERWQVSFGSPLGPGSDHRPFYDEGVPCVFLEFWPYAPWHLPSDTIDKVSEDTIARSAQAAAILLQNWSV
jgi:aminopeptidase YwaD